jgi:cyclomaltodextrinase
MADWAKDAIFYHIYPLGLCGAPHENGPHITPQDRLEKLIPWLDHARGLGCNALYLGPVMESSSHGYDTMDYFQVDRRLGDGPALTRLVEAAHERGFKVVLDAVFNHVGRGFWAFRDVLENGQASRFNGWFHLDWSGHSPFDDPFAYEGWNGCQDLVKLNLKNPEVKSHLFEAVLTWLRDYRIDGLRLDAADAMDLGFLSELARHCHSLEPDFWLLGEVLHGDYRRWTKEAGLDSVTNYECYKGLFSSFNDSNLFEIAHSLRRQYGDYGLYRGQHLYSFADNHDVPRLASQLKNPRHIYPLYCLLFTMPGIPSIYYGSEFGLKGQKNPSDDWPLRPALDLSRLSNGGGDGQLRQALTRLAGLRARNRALSHGDYGEMVIGPRHLAFTRCHEGRRLVVAVSAEEQVTRLDLAIPGVGQAMLVDLLNDGQIHPVMGGRAQGLELWPGWARVMEVRV